MSMVVLILQTGQADMHSHPGSCCLVGKAPLRIIHIEICNGRIHCHGSKSELARQYHQALCKRCREGKLPNTANPLVTSGETSKKRTTVVPLLVPKRMGPRDTIPLRLVCTRRGQQKETIIAELWHHHAALTSNKHVVHHPHCFNMF